MEHVISTQSLTSEAAFIAADAAVKKGLELGVNINAAVTDSAGHLLAFLRADGAFLQSIKLAQDKAYTAACFFMSSLELYEAISSEPDVLAGITKQERIAAFPGGLPVFSGNNIVGAVGVSGATAAQDELCAQAAIDALGLSSSKGE